MLKGGEHRDIKSIGLLPASTTQGANRFILSPVDSDRTQLIGPGKLAPMEDLELVVIYYTDGEQDHVTEIWQLVHTGIKEAEMVPGVL